ncbi:BglG family transcription antiterminator [uncultured Holdemanella sp.]|uniref:BglG family transcription antiterminator n=1 Tax=uncultured Holdemanella sp. TaxID=1763549 RepID=UPI002589DA80|nr:BglG family transcription antiterminator [uncultured Holdemanella sp.]
MFSSSRLEEIFIQISKNEFTTIKELTNSFHVTDRTIRTDIQAINLEIAKYECEILLKRKSGYYLMSYNKDKFKELQNQIEKQTNVLTFNSLDDRIKYILQKLLYSQDYVILDDLANEVFVSRNTLQNYIKPIKEILETYNLIYVSKPNLGVKVFGNEKDKRECLLNEILCKDTPTYIIGFTKEEQMLFRDIDLFEIQTLVNQLLNKHDIHASDYDRKNLIMHCALMISRVKTENYIPFDVQFPIQDDIYELIEQLCIQLENKFDIQITSGEKQYIYLHIASNTHMNIYSVNTVKLQNQITKLLEVIYEEYNFDLRQDAILKKDLFNHFSSILSSKNIYMNKKNPLLNTIKTNFPLPFEITLTSTAKVFSEALTEDEIGYISLHIGAAIERCFTSMYQKKRVVLVCGSGIATTRMLEARLQTFFNSKIVIVNKISYAEFMHYDFANIDFVISTIPIQSDNIPVEIVDFTLKNTDIEKISKRLSHMDKKANFVTKFFDKQLFLHKSNAVTKEDVLKELAHLLENQNIVSDTFIHSVLKRESIACTNLNDIFAIPHPMEACSKETKVAVAILDQPVEWNDKHEEVQIIFMISIKQGEQKQFEHLYDLFIEIVGNTKLQQDIVHSNSFEEFLYTISTVDIFNS